MHALQQLYKCVHEDGLFIVDGFNVEMLASLHTTLVCYWGN